MKKAFFINGGAGRVLCALPALEYHIKNIDPTAIVIAEGWPELYLASPIVAANVITPETKNILEIVKDRELITPEPYRLNAYFNQKCNLVQAFDMLINYDTIPDEIPEAKPFDFTIGKADQVKAYNMLNDIRKNTGKDKVIVFQPFGRGAKKEGPFIYDESGRSMEVKDTVTLIKALSTQYAVIMMSELMPDLDEPIGAIVPNGLNLLQWMGIIQYADYFLGCDSVGQHMANALEKPATVVIGGTFPENISYPSNPNFNIIDNGKGERKYSPIRLGFDFAIERNNENLMVLDNQKIADIGNAVFKALGPNTGAYAKLAQEEAAKASACGTEGCGCGPAPSQMPAQPAELTKPPVEPSKMTKAINQVKKPGTKNKTKTGAKLPKVPAKSENSAVAS